MLIDAFSLLSDAQAVTADAVSTNTIDSGLAGNDLPNGEPLTVALQIDVAADATTGDETYTFEFIQSAAANLGTPTILAQRTIAAASLTAGSIHYLDVPAGAKTQRYLGLNYNVGGTTPTVTVTAWLTLRNAIQSTKVYPDGYAIT